MPRTYKPRPKKHWSNKALEDAITERKAANTSYRELAKKYNVPKSTLERHLTGAPGNQGRKSVSNCVISFCYSNALNERGFY